MPAAELLLPPHAALCSGHSLLSSVLDSLAGLQPGQRPAVRPEPGPVGPVLPGRPPALHPAPPAPAGCAGRPAGPGCWEAAPPLPPAGLRGAAGLERPGLPGAPGADHRGELLGDHSEEWRAGAGRAELLHTDITERRRWRCKSLNISCASVKAS